ncbi:hypothetical protein E2C01_044368 [Portunus trituberculatus]|uniref:Uncharacterized protein n=1 Tax=Portunus trituberculatus TaxID=210409 RepID=A0A5B7FZ50_PORTR|nr:hypothetical protein [Portunus trituberculatus]
MARTPTGICATCHSNVLTALITRPPDIAARQIRSPLAPSSLLQSDPRNDGKVRPGGDTRRVAGDEVLRQRVVKESK